MTDNVLVYVTAGDREEALRIARDAVESRLAACANIIGEITAVFRWEGRIEEGTEVSLLLKTQSRLVDRLRKRIAAVHSYDCPCVVALPITQGNPAFLEWIGTETESD